MNKRKFAFIASLLSVVGLLAGSAPAATKYTTMTDLKGGSDTSHSSETSWGNVFDNGGGISNGTLTVKFKADNWGTFNNLSVTIGRKGVLTANCATAGNKNGQLNIKGGATMTLDGGTFINNNDRTGTYGNMIATDGSDGTMRIINGGVFKSPNIHVELGAKQGSIGTLSVDNGTVEVGGATGGKWLTVGGTRSSSEADADYRGTGILAMTNAELVAQMVVFGSAFKYATSDKAKGNGKYTAKATFKDTKITTQRFYSINDVTKDSFVIFDDATVNTAADGKDVFEALAVDYTLEGKGLTVNAQHTGLSVSGSFSGVGPFIKKGTETLTFKGKFTDSADLRVEEGTLAFSGATLPAADKIDLAISGTGAFEGLDQSATYKSLTLGESAVLPVAFENGAATTFKAAETIVTATADHPVTIAGTGTLTVNTVIAEGLTVTDASLFTLSGVAGSLKIEDGKLIAVKPSRPVDTLTWAKGSAGENWSGTDNWTYGDPAAATTFQDGDTALFATAGDKAVVDADVTAAKVEFTADATVTGTGTATLTTTNITVGADVTATIAAPLSEDIEKTGEGELVLQDYMTGKALDLKEGKVALAWSGAAKEDPISTAMDANAIAGILDLGGATQHVKSSLAGNGTGILRNGGVLLNGKLVIDPTDASQNWWRLASTTFTVGEGATLEIAQATDQGGEIGFNDGACLIIDGGRVNAFNKRATSGTGGYLGDSSGVNMIRIQGDGTFYQPNQFLRVGFKTTGILSVDKGTVDLGGNDLRIASGSSGIAATGVFAMTNGILKAKAVQFSESTSGLSTFILKDSVAAIEQIKKGQTPAAGSSVLFDGAMLVPTAAQADFISDLGIPVTIGEGGLVISNDCEVTVAASLEGAGKLTKKGTGTLKFSGAQAFEGGLEVCGGSIGATLTADGFATQDLALSLNLADGETVQLTIAGTPEPGVNYTLFKSGITEETLSRLTIDANYELSLEDGQLKVKLSPLSLTWTGEGEDNLWSTVANWRNATRGPAKFDTVIFDGESDETEYDLEDGLLFKEIDVNSGAWTTKVDNACFASVPVHVETGALFALTGAKVANPFSTAKDANSIAGVLDFGGATQTFSGALADEKGIFRNGGELRNTTMTVDPTGWFRLHNVSFTIGKDANVTVKKYTDSKGQLNLYNSYLKIDGGSLAVLNERNVSNAGAYIGNNGDATIEILNGGKFSHPNKPVILGYGGDGKGAGALIGDHATVDLGEQALHLGNRNGSASCLALTNSALVCSSITLGFEGTPGKQTVELVNTTATISGVDAKAIGGSASITFDNATIVHSGTNVQVLPDLNSGKTPYTIAEGGLTIKVENIDGDKASLTLPGVFAGEGGITLVAAGKTPKSVGFTGTAAEKGFTGTLVVNNKITVTAANKTFKGGLYACEGSTLNVATSVFEDDVMIEDGVKFTDVPDPTAELLKPVVLLQTKGTITSPLLDYKDPLTKNRYYVRTRDGIKELCYGRKPGTMIIIN